MAYEELLQALVGRKNQLESEDPFYSIGRGVAATSPVVQGASFGDNLGAIGLQGLLAGLGTGIGRSRVDSQVQKESNALRGFYQAPQEQRNQLASSPELAPYAQFLAYDQASQQRDQENEARDLSKAVALAKAKATFENPRLSELAGDVSIEPTANGRYEVKRTGQKMPIAQESASGAQPGSLTNKHLQIFNQLVESGVPSVQASAAADKQMDIERKKMTRTYKAIEASREKAAALESMARTASEGLSGAGRTGPGSSDMLASLAGLVSSDQANKAASTTLLNSIKPDALRAQKVPGMGAMSDFESKQFFAAAPGSDKTPEQNSALIRKIQQAAQIEQQYADFVESYVEDKGTDVGAQQAWDKYKREVMPEIFSGTQSQATSGGDVITAPDGKKFRFID